MNRIVLILVLLSSHIFAGGLFSAGNKNFGFSLGSSSNFNNNYTVVGVHVNYFVLDNLSVGTHYKGFFGASPKIHQVTVPVTYHLPLESTTYKPYLGAFYNRTFMEKPFEDYNIYGGRVGVSVQTSMNSFFSFGWVQEFSSNQKSIKKQGYPEVTAGFSF